MSRTPCQPAVPLPPGRGRAFSVPQINKRVVHRAMEVMGLRAAIRAGTELQALAFSTAASQAYRAQFKRDGSSVRSLLSQRDAAFGDYRERDQKA
jgi:enoyl-CoA hydratase